MFAGFIEWNARIAGTVSLEGIMARIFSDHRVPGREETC
jgi:hypothetical protein